MIQMSAIIILGLLIGTTGTNVGKQASATITVSLTVIASEQLAMNIEDAGEGAAIVEYASITTGGEGEPQKGRYLIADWLQSDEPAAVLTLMEGQVDVGLADTAFAMRLDDDVVGSWRLAFASVRQ